MLLRNTRGTIRRSLTQMLEEPAALPRGSRRVMEGVFWGRAATESECRVLAFRRRAASPNVDDALEDE